ncbi:hypothetical protein L211DRAFT_447071 [Terfezia boudieri ATCC MYA-4762]|uniref:Uncharacterized protein n=1 Tax=Terfezia boudieri ATCC MYA-4762 TaxID=1051890 RepID=A0A3N4LTD7_9PEZI|nr:hypothetical protein L211DRAFT_447071 [Terfezia boudieri ATCC MYA-4762]
MITFQTYRTWIYLSHWCIPHPQLRGFSFLFFFLIHVILGHVKLQRRRLQQNPSGTVMDEWIDREISCCFGERYVPGLIVLRHCDTHVFSESSKRQTDRKTQKMTEYPT